MSTLDPFAFIDLSNLSKMTILPALSTRCSSVVKGGPGSCGSVAKQRAYLVTNGTIENYHQQLLRKSAGKPTATHDKDDCNTSSIA